MKEDIFVSGAKPVKGEGSFLESTFSSFSEIEKQVENTVEMIEKLLARTNWLAQEDKAAVYNWIQAQKRAAENYKVFIDQRTQKIAEFISPSSEEGEYT